MVVGALVCLLTPDADGLRLGIGVAVFAGVNGILVERAFRLTKPQVG